MSEVTAPQFPSDEALLQSVQHATARRKAPVSLSTEFGACRTPPEQTKDNSIPAEYFCHTLPIPIRRDMEARIQLLGTVCVLYLMPKSLS